MVLLVQSYAAVGVVGVVFLRQSTVPESSRWWWCRGELEARLRGGRDGDGPGAALTGGGGDDGDGVVHAGRVVGPGDGECTGDTAVDDRGHRRDDRSGAVETLRSSRVVVFGDTKPGWGAAVMVTAQVLPSPAGAVTMVTV